MSSVYDPWNPLCEIDITKNGNYKFIGARKIIENEPNLPMNKKIILHNNKTIIERYYISTNVSIKNNGNINISSIERGDSGYKIFDIILKYQKNNHLHAHLENITKTKYYSGSDIMIMVLQIFHRLGVKKATLKDSSYFECTRNNFFKKKDVPIKFLKLFKNKNTFYSNFGFNPYDKTTKKNRYNDILKLVSDMYDVSWEKLDEIIVNGKHQIEKSELNGVNMVYNRYEIFNLNKWKKYWIVIYHSWMNFKKKYFLLSSSPFRAFEYFTEDNCGEFIDWLELYSYTFLNYNKIVSYHFLNKIFDIPNIKTINQLKEIINNVEWINSDIYAQTDIIKKSI